MIPEFVCEVIVSVQWGLLRWLSLGVLVGGNVFTAVFLHPHLKKGGARAKGAASAMVSYYHRRITSVGEKVYGLGIYFSGFWWNLLCLPFSIKL